MNIKFYGFLVSIVFLSGCSNYVTNPDFPQSGAMYVLKETPPPPVPAPEPEPEPVPEPVMSVAEQNSKAISALSSLGFEAKESESGVLVYLPPSIHFKRGTSGINLDARAKIAQISAEVNKDYLIDRGIEVSGHSDTVGSAEINLAVSKERAEAAAAELVFSNVPLTRLTITWFGEQRPRVNEYDANNKLIRANQDLNRRVEFTILNPGS